MTRPWASDGIATDATMSETMETMFLIVIVYTIVQVFVGNRVKAKVANNKIGEQVGLEKQPSRRSVGAQCRSVQWGNSYDCNCNVANAI